MKVTRERVARLHFEKRWCEGHQAGRVHQFEGSKILAGDYSAIVRELEPAFVKDEKHVLSRSRPRGALRRDPVTGVETVYPKPPAADMFWIVIRNVVRHRNGYWRVLFDVWDRRERDLYVRRKPPVYTQGDDETETPDEEQVAIDSAYTLNPAQALDSLAAVPRAYNNVLELRANERWEMHQRETRNEELAKQQVRTIAQTAREYSITAGKLGLDPTLVLAEVERMIASEMEELEKAA